MPVIADHGKFLQIVNLIVVLPMLLQLMTKDTVIRNAHGNVRVQSVMRSASQSVRLHSVRPDVRALTHPVVVWSVTSLNVHWSAPRDSVKLAAAQPVQQHAVSQSAS